jgi:hypothetical protein
MKPHELTATTAMLELRMRKAAPTSDYTAQFNNGDAVDDKRRL